MKKINLIFVFLMHSYYLKAIDLRPVNLKVISGMSYSSIELNDKFGINLGLEKFFDLNNFSIGYLTQYFHQKKQFKWYYENDYKVIQTISIHNINASKVFFTEKKISLNLGLGYQFVNFKTNIVSENSDLKNFIKPIKLKTNYFTFHFKVNYKLIKSLGLIFSINHIHLAKKHNYLNSLFGIYYLIE